MKRVEKKLENSR